jgi:4-methyl-5(b-hydroxyethyl)-thiazole monophosphate biosynthesis
MIYEFLADGFEEVEALAVVDVLRRAECEVKTVSIMASKTVMGAHDVPVAADIMFADCDFADAELVILPGGLPGATNLADHAGVTELLKKQNASGKRIAAICASPAKVLAKHGLLNGKKATCYPGLEAELTDAQPVEDVVVTDGNITTSRGPATAVAFGLELARLMAGEKKAEEVRDGFLYSMIAK